MTCVSEKRGDGEGSDWDSEDSERGVGVGVNDTILFTTLQVVGLTETAGTTIRLRKTPMNLCVSDNLNTIEGGIKIFFLFIMNQENES